MHIPSGVRTVFWALVVSFFGLTLFLFVTGALDPGQAQAMAIASGVAALLVVWYVWSSHRAHLTGGRDRREQQARERRGF